jgi:hypothetical protein
MKTVLLGKGKNYSDEAHVLHFFLFDDARSINTVGLRDWVQILIPGKIRTAFTVKPLISA